MPDRSQLVHPGGVRPGQETLQCLPGVRTCAITSRATLSVAELTGCSEVMAHGMPDYRHGGKSEVAFAVQRNDLSFYLMREDVREAFAPQPAGPDMGKGCLRFRGPASPDPELVRDLLRAVAADPGGRVR